MILEKQVVSLEIAKKLKELGVEQKNTFYWNKGMYDTKFYLENCPIDFESDESYQAYTAAELAEMLPFYLVDKGELTINKNYRRDKLTAWNVRYKKTVNCTDKQLPTICATTMANALGKMLIYLIENKLINVGEPNEHI